MLLWGGGTVRAVGMEGATMTAGSPKFFSPPQSPQGPRQLRRVLSQLLRWKMPAPLLLALPPQGCSF